MLPQRSVYLWESAHMSLLTNLFNGLANQMMFLPACQESHFSTSRQTLLSKTVPLHIKWKFECIG